MTFPPHLRWLFCVSWWCFISLAQAQNNTVQEDDALLDISFPVLTENKQLKSNWKFKQGDDPLWADRTFDDRNWKLINPQLWLDSLQRSQFGGIGWFRLHFKMDKTTLGKPFMLRVWQRGASEIYLDGKLVHSFGKVSQQTEQETKYNPFGYPIVINFEDDQPHVLAVRYSASNAWQLFDRYERFARTAGFRMYISQANTNLEKIINQFKITTFTETLFFGILIGLGALHLFLYIFYPAILANLYYSLYSLSIGITFYISYKHHKSHQVDWVIFYNWLDFVLTFVVVLLLLLMLYALFINKVARVYWVLVGLFVLNLVVMFHEMWSNVAAGAFYLLALGEIIRLMHHSIKQKKKGALLIGSGVLLALFCSLLHALFANFLAFNLPIPTAISNLVLYISFLSISTVMSIFLSRSFAQTHYALEGRLREVEFLSAKAIAQEQEKQEILEAQNEKLEKLVALRTQEIEAQNEELAQQNDEIQAQRDAISHKSAQLADVLEHTRDSIVYAQRIQQAVLGEVADIQKVFPKAFIFYQPKDIVSGDFYWFESLRPKQAPNKEYKILVAADCTGHGVPGAFMTMLGIDFLDEIILGQEVFQPCDILQHLNKKLYTKLRNSQNQVNDGMDIGIVIWQPETRTLSFSGAKNDLWYIRNQTLLEIKGARTPVGGGQFSDEKAYQTHQLQVEPGDMFYLFSDGYQDQFGGAFEKKYMRKRLREFLLEIHPQPLATQQQLLADELNHWKDSQEQTDDVMVIGFQLL